MPTHRVSDENLVEQFDGPRLYQQVDAGPLVHRVRRGETGASIARRYGLTLAELRAMNRRVSPLKPGMTLTVRRSQKQTVLVAEDGSRKVISRQAAVPATATAKAATASSGSHTAIRLVHYSPARTQTAGSSNTAASRSTASRLDSRVTLRSDRSATRHTLRQSGKTTVALADTTSRSRSAAASTSTRSTTTHKSASATTTTGKRLKAASASSATSRGSASSRSASTKAASAKSASSRKAVNSSTTRASSRGTATRTKAGSTRARGSHKVADAR